VTKQASEWAKRYYAQSPDQDIAARFITILAKYCPSDLKLVTPSTTFVEDLKLTDLEPVEILLAMESEFQIAVSDKESESLVSIKDVISYLSKSLEMKKVPNKPPDTTPAATTPSSSTDSMPSTSASKL
jgi:acyl carrier protein